MNRIKTFLFLVPFFAITQASAQQLHLQSIVGFGSENNIGEHGLLIGTGLQYATKSPFLLYARLSMFQRLGRNEQFDYLAYPSVRDATLNTLTLDLGAGIDFVRKNEFTMGIILGPSLRHTRRMLANGVLREPVLNSTVISYEYEQLNEIGGFVNLQTRLALTEKTDLLLEINSQAYEFLGQYLGLGVGFQVKL